MARKRYLSVVALAAAALVSCGGGDSAPERSIRVEIADPDASTVLVEAPDTAAAGRVDITVENRGDTAHDAQIFRVDGNRTAEDVVDFVRSFDFDAKPAWIHPAGGVAAVSPGDEATATQLLAPGTYFVVDTQERDRGVSNAERGGIAKIRVRGRAEGRLPATSARMTATDVGFRTAGIRSGPSDVTFRNAGSEFHQVVAFRAPEGVGFEEAKRRLIDRHSALGTRWMPVPVDHTHATAMLEPGFAQVVTLDLEPGTYLLTCFAQDRAGGDAHIQDGVVSKLLVE